MDIKPFETNGELLQPLFIKRSPSATSLNGAEGDDGGDGGENANNNLLATSSSTSTSLTNNNNNNNNNNNSTIPQTSSSSLNSPTPDRIDWPRPTILRFIDDYRNLRVLWDANTKGYHMKQTKCEALKALSHKYGTEIRAIRSKIKSLRSSFHREHGKVLSNRRKGINYQPMWFAYEAIRFILDGSDTTTTPRSPTLTSTLSQQNENENNVNGSGSGGSGNDNYNGDNDYDIKNINCGIDGVDIGCDGDGGSGGDVSGIVSGLHHATTITCLRGRGRRRGRACGFVKADDDYGDGDGGSGGGDCGEEYIDDNVEYGEGDFNAEEKFALLLNDDKSSFGSAASVAAAAALTMLTAATTFKDENNSNGGLEGGDVATATPPTTTTTTTDIIAATATDEDPQPAAKKLKMETAFKTTTTTRSRATNKSAKKVLDALIKKIDGATQSCKANAATTIIPTTTTTTTSSTNTKITSNNTTTITTAVTTATTATTTPPMSPTLTANIRLSAAHDNYAAGSDSGSGTGTGTGNGSGTGTGAGTTSRESCFPKLDGIIDIKADAVAAAASYPSTILGRNSATSPINTAAAAAAAAASTAIDNTNSNLALGIANLPSSLMCSRSAAATIFLNAIAANTALMKTITTTTTTTKNSTPLTKTPLDELTAAFRTDMENDSQNYCNISAEDVKTEIIESDSTEAMLMSMDQRSNEYRTNFFKNFELQQRESPKFNAPTLNQQQQQQQQNNRKRKSNNMLSSNYHQRQQQQQQQQQQQHHDDVLNLAKMHSNFLTNVTSQARAQDLSTHNNICAMTAIPAGGIQLNPNGNLKTGHNSNRNNSNGSNNISISSTNLSYKETLTNAAPKAIALATATTPSSSSSTASSTASTSTSATTTNPNHIDEYGIFGEYVAMTIRKLKTTKAKIAIKHLINNLLYEGELGTYDHGIPAGKEPPQLYKT